MKLQVKTTKLQEMLSKAVKGCGNNKLAPITSLIAIKVANGKLELETTDGSNYLYIRENVDAEDFYTVVQTDTFAKLVARITSEDVTLEVTDSALVISGNGTYKIDIPLEEDGDVVLYPNPAEHFQRDNKVGHLTVAEIKTILTSVKPALLVGISNNPWYENYYVGESVIGTDTFKICGYSQHIFDKAKLISPEMMNLVDVASGDMDVYANYDKLLFESDNCTIYGVEANGIEEYTTSVSAIGELLNQKFNSHCKLAKNAIIQALDRISLFVGADDNGEITLAFTQSGVNVSSKNVSGDEVIAYLDNGEFHDFVCSVDINTLMSQIKAQSGDAVELWYGEDNALKIVDGNITSIVALLGE